MKKLLFIFTTMISILFIVGCEKPMLKVEISAKDGKDGTNGTNGLSTVANVEIVYDTVRQVNGAKTSYYWDSDNVPGYSAGDTPQNKFFIIWDGVNGTNGTNGTNGIDGKTPTLSYGIISSTTCASKQKTYFASFLDGKLMGDTIFFCVPVNGTNGTNGTDGTNGLNGITPTLQTIVYSYGIQYIWYSGSTVISNQIISNGISFPCITDAYNLQGASANYFGNTGIILNNFVYSESDGALYLDKTSGSILLPPFASNAKLLFHSFKHGSKKTYTVTVKVVHSDNSEEIVKSVKLDGNPNFQKNVFSTYSIFEYRVDDINNIKFKNVKRMKIEVSLYGKCVPEDYFIDDFKSVLTL